MNWSKDQELSELKASLETINRTADTIITGIDRNLKEIVREREAQQEQGQEKEVLPENKKQPDTPWLSTSTSITPAGLLTPDCGMVITMQDLADYGYPNHDLLPLTKDKAYALFDQDAAIYSLYENGSADMVVNHDEITAHNGFFGIEYTDWITTPDYQQRLSRHIEETDRMEQTFLTKMKEPAMMIYQLMPDEQLADYHFAAFDQLSSKKLAVERKHYEPIYAMAMPTTEIKPDQLLEGIFHAFNVNRPDDFKGHSLSVSDIVALKVNGEVSFHYVDSFGFRGLDGFLPDNPLKNAEMTVEDDYGMIDGIINNGKNPALEQPQPSEPQKEVRKKEPPSILARLNEPQSARTAPKKDGPKKNKGLEL